MADTAVRLAVTITLQGPLVLADRRPCGQPEPLDYVPGARLRGALAALLHEERTLSTPPSSPPSLGPAEDHRWATLFDGPTPVRFLDGRPQPAAELLPATAASCTDLPGFASSRAGHGVFDTLIDRACWETLSPAGLQYQPRCPHPDCDSLARRWTAAYGVHPAGGRAAYREFQLPLRRLAGVAVSVQRGVADERAVYTLPVVEAAWLDAHAATPTRRPMVFEARVVAPDENAAALVRELLPRVETLGGGASRGLGAVRVAVAEATEEEPLAARLERFRAAFALRRSQYAQLAPQSAAALEGSYFSLDLRSDTLLRTSGWAPATVVDADMLRAAASVDDPTLTLVRAYARPGWRGGWQASWALPRPAELVAARASCYLFRTARLALWEEALARLETVGLGERTAEGFGDVRVCDPFHLIWREQSV